MNIDNDYDEDGNNIVPCPICLDVYCPSKEDGKCPEEDEFVKAMTPSTPKETTPYTESSKGTGSNGYAEGAENIKGAKGETGHTPDTEDWEKEFDSIVEEDYEYRLRDLGVQEKLKSLISKAITSRDTYWKERVEEEKKKWQTWVQHDVTCYLYTEEGDSKDCTCGLYHAFTNEDNLK